jgi:hypothetical protein
MRHESIRACNASTASYALTMLHCCMHEAQAVWPATRTTATARQAAQGNAAYSARARGLRVCRASELAWLIASTTDPTPMRPCPCNGRHRNERGGRRIQQASRDFRGIHACPRAKPTPPVHANSRKCNARGPPALGLHRSRSRVCVWVDCTAEAQGTLGFLSLLCSGQLARTYNAI